jgi:hypothetical protein
VVQAWSVAELLRCWAETAPAAQPTAAPASEEALVEREH